MSFESGEKRKSRAVVKGLKVSLVLLVLGIVVIAVVLGVNYSGGCPSLSDGGGRDCSSLGGYLTELVLVIFLLFVFYGWITIPVLALPIVIGFLIDLFSSGRE